VVSVDSDFTTDSEDEEDDEEDYEDEDDAFAQARNRGAASRQGQKMLAKSRAKKTKARIDKTKKTGRGSSGKTEYESESRIKGWLSLSCWCLVSYGVVHLTYSYGILI